MKLRASRCPYPSLSEFQDRDSRNPPQKRYVPIVPIVPILKGVMCVRAIRLYVLYTRPHAQGNSKIHRDIGHIGPFRSRSEILCPYRPYLGKVSAVEAALR